MPDNFHISIFNDRTAKCQDGQSTVQPYNGVTLTPSDAFNVSAIKLLEKAGTGFYRCGERAIGQGAAGGGLIAGLADFEGHAAALQNGDFTGGGGEQQR